MTHPDKDLGTLVKLDGRDAVRYERVYPHAVDRVWRALIEPASIKAWFPTTIDGLERAATDKRAGEKLRFTFEGEDGPTLEGELRASDPHRLLEYTWGDDLLRFELSATGPSDTHTKLVFTVTFGERSQAPRDATGWHFCLDNLANDLGGKEPEPVGEAFAAVSAQYQKQLGGDFPNIVKGAKAGELARELPSKDLEGQLFKASNGTTLVLARASRSTDVEHRDLPKGGYLVVIEGAFELHIGGHQMKLTAGMEFHIPDGAHVRGRMDAGTRIAFAAPSA